MLFGIATHTAFPGLEAPFRCRTDSRLGVYARRVSRLPTLDGGAALVDTGFSHADRTVQLGLTAPSAATVATLKSLVALHDRLMLFLPDGAWAAAPQSFDDTPGRETLTLLIVGGASNA